MKKNNFSKGYSLIELVVYISLFVLIAVVVIQSLIYAMKTYSSARNYRALQRNAETTLSRLTTEVRSAKTVSISSSSFGVALGTLALNGVDNNGSPYNPTFSLVNGVVYIVDSGVSTPLSNSEVIFNELTFWNITTANSDAIKIKTTLSTTKLPVITKTFYTTVILRE